MKIFLAVYSDANFVDYDNLAFIDRKSCQTRVDILNDCGEIPYWMIDELDLVEAKLDTKL